MHTAFAFLINAPHKGAQRAPDSSPPLPPSPLQNPVTSLQRWLWLISLLRCLFAKGVWSMIASNLSSVALGGEPVLPKINSTLAGTWRFILSFNAMGAANLTAHVYHGTAQNNVVSNRRGLSQVRPTFPQCTCRHWVPRWEFSSGGINGVRKQLKILPLQKPIAN